MTRFALWLLVTGLLAAVVLVVHLRWHPWRAVRWSAGNSWSMWRFAWMDAQPVRGLGTGSEE